MARVWGTLLHNWQKLHPIIHVPSQALRLGEVYSVGAEERQETEVEGDSVTSPWPDFHRRLNFPRQHADGHNSQSGRAERTQEEAHDWYLNERPSAEGSVIESEGNMFRRFSQKLCKGSDNEPNVIGNVEKKKECSWKCLLFSFPEQRKSSICFLTSQHPVHRMVMLQPPAS